MSVAKDRPFPDHGGAVWPGAPQPPALRLGLTEGVRGALKMGALHDRVMPRDVLDAQSGA